jgi:hypothetical protein
VVTSPYPLPAKDIPALGPAQQLVKRRVV